MRVLTCSMTTLILQILLNLTDVFFPYGTEPAALLDDITDCHPVVWILLV